VIPPNAKGKIDAEVERLLRESGQWGKYPTNFKIISEFSSVQFNETPIESKGFFHALCSFAKDKAKKALEMISHKVPLLEEAFKKIRGIILFEERMIFVDHSSHFQRIKWYKWHELGHAIVPWHEGILKQCREEDMNPWAREAMEAEANYCASQLVFQGNNFNDLIQQIDTDEGFETIDSLHIHCDISLESTAREFARRYDSPNFYFFLIRQSAKTGKILPFDHSLPGGVDISMERFHSVKNDVFNRINESADDRMLFESYQMLINSKEVPIIIDALKTPYTNFALFKVPKMGIQ
jgi:Zn-dependent peptidase ImmA (M78 family)